MKKILEYLFNYNKLKYDQAKEILIDITSNKYSHSEIASFMTIYKMRNPSIEEMEGFRDALMILTLLIFAGQVVMGKTLSTYQRFLHLL